MSVLADRDIRTRIEAELRAAGSSEIPSSRVGALAMDKLRGIDQIAYIRFASVYQSFEDLEDLKREVDSLYSSRADDVPGQTTLELIDTARGPVPGNRRMVKR